MASRYKFFRDVWNDELQHTQKGFPESSLEKRFKSDDDVTYKIPLQYRYRPDLIAMLFYNDPKLFWVIVYANGFYNSPQDFEVGVNIRVPRYERIIGMV